MNFKKAIIIYMALLVSSTSTVQAATCAENFREAVGTKELQKESDLILKGNVAAAGVMTAVGIGAGVYGFHRINSYSVGDKIAGGVTTGLVAASTTGTSIMLVVQGLNSAAVFNSRLARLTDDAYIFEGIELDRFVHEAEGLLRQSTQTFDGSLARLALSKVINEKPELCQNNQVTLVYSNIINAMLAQYKTELLSSQK